ncbi:MAG: PspA/IM30 family protein [Sandaracinaceae bacterium]|nr:PspA/IM30 family protein [Sandaracinaceae bacterium]
MGIFSRLATLIKSNINDMITRAEDPEKMLNQIILDMNTQLIEAKKQVAVAIADQKRLERQWLSEKQKVEEWHQKAMLAVRAGNDELAKEALLRKKEHERLAAGFEEQYRKQTEAVNQVKTALQALNNKIEEAKRKKELLIARNNRAKAMEGIQRAMGRLSESSAFDAFARMEQKIEQREAEVEARTELSDEFSGDTLRNRFAKLEATAGAEAELEALKREMGLLPPVETRARVEPQAAISDADMAELEAALEELKKREQGGRSS